MNLKNGILINLLFVLCVFVACQENGETQPTEAISEKRMDKKEKLLRHVVVFKFNEESSEEDVNRLNESFNRLTETIPVIKDFEWGINNSPENLDQGFTHCYLLSFGSEEDRDSVYLPHPDHQAFVKSLKPHLEKVFVVDYWANP